MDMNQTFETLSDYMAHKPIFCNQVIQLGLDICNELIMSSKYHIVYGDIEPNRIMVIQERYRIDNREEKYDNRYAELGIKIKDSNEYMAPEVYAGGNYDERADVYSLGLMMYVMCNEGIAPFLSADISENQYKKRQDAQERRFAGEALQKPIHFVQGLTDIILKACDYNPLERYQSADECKKALEQLTLSEYEKKCCMIQPAKVITGEAHKTKYKIIISIVMVVFVLILFSIIIISILIN